MSNQECLRAYEDGKNCRGEVTGRQATTTVIWECDYHMTKSLQRNREIQERYPDSSVAPSWFDPDDAGEYWDDDY